MPDSIRILIVDDHAVVREGLRTFLEPKTVILNARPSAYPAND